MRFAIPLIPLLFACNGPSTAPSQRDTLNIVGSHTIMDHLAPQLAEAHGRTYTNVQFQLSPSDSADGFRAVLGGEAVFAASTRAPTFAEQDQAKKNGYDLAGSGHIIGVDVIAVSTHGSNPLDSLTYDQVIGIFCSDAIDNWSYLGRDDQPIRVVALPPNSGTRALFEDFFCGPKGFHRRVEIAESNQVSEILSSDPAAISFISMSHRAGKTMSLRPEAQAKAIVPSKKNIIRGVYPLAQDLMLYSAGELSGSAQSFLDWIKSPAGQDVVDEAHFVPLFLRPELMDEPRPLRETIHFEPGSSRPTSRSIARIGLLIEELRERVGEHNHIVLEGYTDNRESEPAELSQKRAETVKEILSEALPDRFFEIIPRGKVHPIAPNETPFGRQRNRRVQIYLADEENQVPNEDVAIEPDAP